jgi:hypothetical protein
MWYSRRIAWTLAGILIASVVAACRNSPPEVGEIDVSPSTTVNTGDTASMTTTVSGSGSSMKFKWTAKRGRLEGADTASVLYYAPDQAGPDTVTLEVTNDGGTTVRAKTLDVVPSAEAITPANPTPEPTTGATIEETVAPTPLSGAPTEAAGTPTAAGAASQKPSGESCVGDTSEVLNQQAWAALDAGDWDKAIACAELVVRRWSGKADAQQTAKQKAQECNYTPKADDKQAIDSFWATYWALNDVATASFVAGKAYEGKGEADQAREAYTAVVGKYPCAYAWDPKGWFWRVGDAAQERLDAMR